MKIQEDTKQSQTLLGVVIVVYDSADVIIDVLETLFSSAKLDDVALQVAVVDNASPDGSLGCIERWASGATPYSSTVTPLFDVVQVEKPVHNLDVLCSNVNAGFAGAVNIGLKHLFTRLNLSRVWILNPDSIVPPGTVGAFAHSQQDRFSLMGGRVLYQNNPDIIQIDGGQFNQRTGVTSNINLRAPSNSNPPAIKELDFITGASMVVSRAFYEAAGPMQEDYFLYYEEVDWALRRGDLPLAYCPDAIVYHRGGTAIGSPVPSRPASPFSLYFKHRARLRFMRRHFPRNVPFALAYSCAKAAQLALKGYLTEAWTILYASFGRPPSKAIRARLGPEAAALLAQFDRDRA